MIKLLISNACILVTVIFISSQFFKNINLTTNSPLKHKVLLGFLGGLSTIVLISYSIPITSFSILDFRHLIEILVAILGGIIPAIITGTIDALYRLTFNGVNQSSIIIGAGVYYLVQYLITSIKLTHSLKKTSDIDFLTGLNNTRAFNYNYSRLLSSIVEEKKSLSFLMIDIDHFKKINDTYGHIAGDEILREFGNVLINTFRDNDFVSRIGGEEFTAILKDLNLEKTMEIAERLRENIEAHIFSLSDGRKIQITASIGVALYPDTVGNIKNLKEIADNKLYEAKKTGRNKVCI